MDKKPSTSPEHDLGDQIEHYLQGSSEDGVVVSTEKIEPADARSRIEEVADLDFDVDVELSTEDQDFPPTEEEVEILDDNKFALVDEENPTEDEPDYKLIEEFDLDLAAIAGEVIESRPLQGNILAKVSVEENNLGFPEGVYLVLKIKGEELLIYGGEHADKLDEETINMIYQDVDLTEKFLEMSAEFKKKMDIEQLNKLDKFRKEMGTIGGIVLEYRFLQGNLLSLVKIDRAMHEAAFEEETDSKLLQRKLIQRGEEIDCVEGLRDGIYAIFVYGATRMILGGEDAHKLDPEEVKTIFESLENSAHFFDEDRRLKKYLKDLEAEEKEENELAEKEQKLAQTLAELDEPITGANEVPEVKKLDEDPEEAEALNKLLSDIGELINEKNDD